MAKMPDHIHKYKKINLGRNGKEYLVYRCMKPDCSHYVPIAMAEGKLAECNRCEQPFIISKVQLTGSSMKPMTRPHCNDCIDRKKVKDEDVAAIAAFIAGNETKAD